jgi:hypothetical protein
MRKSDKMSGMNMPGGVTNKNDDDRDTEDDGAT